MNFNPYLSTDETEEGEIIKESEKVDEPIDLEKLEEKKLNQTKYIEEVRTD